MSKVRPMTPNNAPDTLPELFTDSQVAEYGEVLSTTCAGCIFVRADNNSIYLFTPVARVYGSEDHYYQRVDFK